MKEFRPAKKRIEVSVGESVRIIRELQGLSQNQLAELTGIPKTTISAIENDRVGLVWNEQKCSLGLSNVIRQYWCFPDGRAQSSPRHSAWL